VWIMLGSAAPGHPAWQVDTAVISELLHESLNFFYVNVAAHAAGITLIPCIPEHPVSEALFNFVAAWGLLFLPLMATDRAGRRVVRWQLWWGGIMLLTNVFFVPYLALRAVPEAHPSHLTPSQRTAASLSSSAAAASAKTILKGSAAARAAATKVVAAEARWAATGRAVGGAAMFFGGVSLAWAAAARPEYGDVPARVAYAGQRFASERVFYAFVVDMGLYTFWQAWMMRDAGAPRRFCALPFFGLAAWLVAGRPKE
jgi:hypothetical protein